LKFGRHPANPLPFEQTIGVAVAEAADHSRIVTRGVTTCKSRQVDPGDPGSSGRIKVRPLSRLANVAVLSCEGPSEARVSSASTRS
jgi:hypothetical protein